VGFYDRYYRAVVQTVERRSPNLVRVVVGGADLGSFTGSGVADERLVVVFPRSGESEPPAPIETSDGRQDYPEDAGAPPMRSITVRSWSAQRREIVLDIVPHEGGAAGPWASSAQPGQVVYLTEARGWYAPPAEAAWQLLVADVTGLPALERIVEELPADVRAYVLVEVPDPADRPRLASAATVVPRCLVGSGHGRGPSGLLSAIRELDWPDGPGYVWFAGEAAESRAVRKYLRRERNWPRDHSTILGYWRVDQEAWLDRYAPVGAELEQVYARAVAAGHPSDEALELYDNAVEAAGL
jgi:NADPH-dependent ferric siderophore reductase